MFTFPLLLTIYAGFTHAFEADHLLAVSNIVSQRDRTWLSVKDGIVWGFGHSSTIVFIGALVILFKVGISVHSFHYFEAVVGLMLIALAVYRLLKFFRSKKFVVHKHAHVHAGGPHKHIHLHLEPQHHPHPHLQNHTHNHSHSLAYGVGLVHGLAGSGALVLLAMSQIKSPAQGIIFLVIFSMGCTAGMLVAAGLFSVPFSKKLIQAPVLQTILIIATSLLCLLYGGEVIYNNLVA
ncbi:MAG TPA: urease accessory protein [Mucilaginibacter sp.]|jgi:cytochrome c biogenesis protein CcdA